MGSDGKKRRKRMGDLLNPAFKSILSAACEGLQCGAGTGVYYTEESITIEEADGTPYTFTQRWRNIVCPARLIDGQWKHPVVRFPERIQDREEWMRRYRGWAQ